MPDVCAEKSVFFLRLGLLSLRKRSFSKTLNQLGFLPVYVLFEIFLYLVSPVSTYSAKYIDT